MVAFEAKSMGLPSPKAAKSRLALYFSLMFSALPKELYSQVQQNVLPVDAIAKHEDFDVWYSDGERALRFEGLGRKSPTASR